MEAVEKIKEATFDINTIGLYDAERKIENGKKKQN